MGQKNRTVAVASSGSFLLNGQKFLLWLKPGAVDYPQPRQIGLQPENKPTHLYDGCRILKQLKFASNRHDASFANVSMADAINLACRDDAQLRTLVKAIASGLLGKTQIHRSRLQLDIDVNLINRREVMETYKAIQTRSALHTFTQTGRP